MKLKVFDNTPEEQEVRLRLVSAGPKTIRLVAVDKNGRTVAGGNLLDITPEGVRLLYFVTEDLGFPITKNPSRTLLVVD